MLFQVTVLSDDISTDLYIKYIDVYRYLAHFKAIKNSQIRIYLPFLSNVEQIFLDNGGELPTALLLVWN